MVWKIQNYMLCLFLKCLFAVLIICCNRCSEVGEPLGLIKGEDARKDLKSYFSLLLIGESILSEQTPNTADSISFGVPGYFILVSNIIDFKYYKKSDIQLYKRFVKDCMLNAVNKDKRPKLLSCGRRYELVPVELYEDYLDEKKYGVKK